MYNFIDRIVGFLFIGLANTIPIWTYARLPTGNRNFTTLLIHLGLIEFGALLIFPLGFLGGESILSAVGIGLSTFGLGLTSSSILVGESTASEENRQSGVNAGLVFLGFQELAVIFSFVGFFVTNVKVVAIGFGFVNIGIYFIADVAIYGAFLGHSTIGQGLIQAAFVELNLVFTFLLGIISGAAQIVLILGGASIGLLGLFLGIFASQFARTDLIEGNTSTDFFISAGIFEVVTLLLLVTLLL